MQLVEGGGLTAAYGGTGLQGDTDEVQLQLARPTGPAGGRRHGEVEGPEGGRIGNGGRQDGSPGKSATGMARGLRPRWRAPASDPVRRGYGEMARQIAGNRGFSWPGRGREVAWRRHREPADSTHPGDLPSRGKSRDSLSRARARVNWRVEVSGVRTNPPAGLQGARARGVSFGPRARFELPSLEAPVSPQILVSASVPNTGARDSLNFGVRGATLGELNEPAAETADRRVNAKRR